jgi:hypothetical protein
MASNFPIPEAALDDRLAFVGTSGSGKTYNAGSAVEILLASSAKVVIIDPLGVWWGLRLQADGKARGFDLPIFGGEHGDLPLNEGAGKLIGETVATMRESCIVDLSALPSKEAERRFMLAFLESLYRHASGDPMHAVFDEADLWAPQNPSKTGAGPQLQSLMEQIVRRGRVKGFIPWLITQRPAVISKDVLSQADGLIAFKLTSSQDRAAIAAWVKGQADEGQWPAIDRSLPSFKRGTGLIWIPTRQILETADFPAKATFDSSATPKRGEKRKRRDLKPLDLDQLKGRLGSIEEEAKANDPKALKGKIATLERELRAAQKAKPARAAPPPQPAPIAEDVLEAARTQGFRDGWMAFAKAIAAILAPEGKAGDPYEINWGTRTLKPRARLHRKREILMSDGSVPSGCSKPLAALAGVYPAGMTEPQWATAAGYKRSGGTWGAYKRRLKAAGDDRGARRPILCDASRRRGDRRCGVAAGRRGLSSRAGGRARCKRRRK